MVAYHLGLVQRVDDLRIPCLRHRTAWPPDPHNSPGLHQNPSWYREATVL